MPFSYAQYAGNGSTKTFSVPFPYLLKAHVRLYTGFNILTGTYTAELVEGTGFTWTSGTQVQTTVAPANGVTLTVIRQTPSSSRVVDWNDGSNLIAADLDTADLQNLYVVQEQQDRNDAAITLSQAAKTAAETATSTASAATSTANAATSTANTALSTANTASTNASAAVTTANAANSNSTAAVSTANTASSNASAAVSTANAASASANTASTNASSAVATANSAAANASSALNTANTALSNANSAVSTANTASSNASAAVATSNTASSNASAAVATANTASNNASSAVTTANTASTNASNAVATANLADAKADQAIAAVASALLYQAVVNVAAIPASPSNQDAVEVNDSTGIESFTPLTGIPAGFAGDAGLSVRIVYNSSSSTWEWFQYSPNDPEGRYVNLLNDHELGGKLGFDPGLSTAPGLHVSGDPDTGFFSDSANTLGLSTNGVKRLDVDGTGQLVIGPNCSLSFEGSTDNGFETSIAVVDPTADRTITLPNITGTVITTGDTGTVTSAMIADGAIVNDDINASAAIADTKLATISTAGKVSNSATTATSANTVSAIVARDSSGNFSAGTIAAALSGNASTASTLQTARTINGVSFDGSANINVDDLTGSNGTTVIDGVGVSSAVNYISVSNAATGGSPTLTTAGSDASINLTLSTKGTGSFNIVTGGGNIALRPTAGSILFYDATNTYYTNLDNGSLTANRTLTMPNGNVTLVAGTMVPTTGTGATGSWAISVTGNSATATTLQAARTINGTSFNGSANITTASWGTARTLWGNSVDGSSDETGPLRPAAGTAAAPAFSVSTDTNTGIYFPAADTIGFSINGTQRGQLTSTGALRLFPNGTGPTVGTADDQAFLVYSANASKTLSVFLNDSTSYASSLIYSPCGRAGSSAYTFVSCDSAGGTDREFTLRGDGNAFADGTWSGGGADYAEYFEWSDGNTDAEDRRGISVVLDGDMIRPALAGEDPIGVISGNPSVTGDSAWNKWSGKHLTDDYGTYIQEEHQVIRWFDENGSEVSYEDWNLPDGLIIPEHAEYLTHDEKGNRFTHRKVNPNYDPNMEYIPREQRPEWDAVGLVGKLRLRKGQPVGSRWIKMRDISDSVEEWLVR